MDDTLTLALEGDVSLDEFAEAVLHFRNLVEALSRAEQAQGVHWLISDLEVSSALTTTRGVAANGVPADEVIDQITRVKDAFLLTGHALESGSQVPFEYDVVREAEAITRVLGGNVKAIRFETAEEEATIAAPATAPDSISKRTTAFGAVEGRVQTLTSRGRLRFTLYDTLHDKAVSCYLAEGHEDAMRDVWGRRAIVEGRVTRDLHGRPTSVRGIAAVQVLPEVMPGSYRQLRGISPSGSISAEEAIRRLRDAG